MQRYINDKYATLLTQATPTVPTVLRVDDLVSAGYLPQGTASRDRAGFDLCGLVLAVGAQGAPVRLQGLLVSESPTGRRSGLLDDLTLSQIVSSMGAAGGAIYSNVGSGAASITGAQGNWSVDTSGPFSRSATHCNGAAGAVPLSPGHYMMALWYGKAFNNEDVLYRKKVNNRPDLNTMQTPLGLNVDNTGQVAFGQACGQEGLLATDAAGSPLNCKGGVWTAGMPVDTTGQVGFGKPCQVNGSFSADGSGQPFNCKQGVWVNGMAKDSSGSVSPGASCQGVPEGSFIAAANGTPMVCKAGQWSGFNGVNIRSRNFTTPGSYSWDVPPGVTSVLLSMTGGGEAGGSTDVLPSSVDLERAGGQGTYTAPEMVNMFPGGSGGYVQEYPVSVVPGSRLCITVGAGGQPHGIPGDYSGRPGQPSSVAACAGSTPSLIICTGGGSNSPWAGAPGSCNVQPSGGTPSYWVQKQGSSVPGAFGLFAYGAGGHAGRCWGMSACGPQPNGGIGGAGTDGAVLLKWVE
jgi:Bacterial shufflon protein, N-terminal constant region